MIMEAKNGLGSTLLTKMNTFLLRNLFVSMCLDVGRSQHGVGNGGHDPLPTLLPCPSLLAPAAEAKVAITVLIPLTLF